MRDACSDSAELLNRCSTTVHVAQTAHLRKTWLSRCVRSHSECVCVIQVCVGRGGGIDKCLDECFLGIFYFTMSQSACSRKMCVCSSQVYFFQKQILVIRIKLAYKT